MRAAQGRVKIMKRFRVGLLLAAALTMAGGAFASVIPGQPNGPESTNLWLYQIYNDLYGTSLTQSSDLVPLELSSETLVLDSSVESLTATAVWRQAHLESDFGIYPVGSPGTQTDVLGPFVNFDAAPILPSGNEGQGDLRPWNITQTVSTAGLTEVGFYQQVRYPNEIDPSQPSGEPDLFTWYSESALNFNGETHVLLLLTTPDPNVLLLAFEDLPYVYLNGALQDLGDQDYQDLLVQITLNRTVVPEPMSISLLGLGLAGFVARRFLKVA